MKFSILLDIVFELLSKRKVTAAYLAEKYEISPRTIYRYVNVIAEKVPVQILRGRSGGITLSDDYKLPVDFMNGEEYHAVMEALGLAYAQNPEERFLNVRKKLSAKRKETLRELSFAGNTETIRIFGVQNPRFLERMRILENCIETLKVAELEYVERNKPTLCRVEPHALIFDKNVWYVYAFCHTERQFRTFHLNRIRSIVKTEETFRKRPIKNDPFTQTNPLSYTDVRLEIDESALSAAQEVFGIEQIRVRAGKYYAEVTLLDDDALPAQILSFGLGVKVISPPALKRKIVALLSDFQNVYS